ncbi:hypothetical protein LCM20_09860 [Halobacillus litoralis]|uniref:hypothetical protein n=1 Tax=Halobacillus litoralis TaxID=45668 RepID=UPI001CD66C04|nr:hypothetical protein [Halobacillus litoralis]MCA0970895.1 hypothetical protein [Halobacillus litoralis]
MKNNKKWLASILVIPFILASTIFSNSMSPVQADSDFSGIEYMQGIVFGYGPVGDVLFAEEDSREPTEEELEIIQEFSSYIESEHSDSVEDLKNSILAKDPNATMESLKVVSEHLNQFVEDRGDELATTGEVNAQCGVVAVCGAAVVLIAHQYVGVTYAAVGGAVVYLAGGTWGPGIDSVEEPERAVAYTLDKLS